MDISSKEVQQEIKKEWRMFLSTNTASPNVIRKETIRAWKRSLMLGVDPYRIKAPVIEDKITFKKIIDKNSRLIDVSTPAIKRLHHFIIGSRFIISLCDEEGNLLLMLGDNDAVKSAAMGQAVVGSNWSEKSMGYNPVGTSIAENRALQVFGYEHYCICSHHWSGSGAPIHDTSGNIIGAVSITGKKEDVNYHTLGMVVMTVFSIEKQLNILETLDVVDLAREHNNIIIDSISEGLMVIDNNNNILKVNKVLSKFIKTSPINICNTKTSELFDDKMVLNMINKKVRFIDYLTKINFNNTTLPCTVTYNTINTKFNSEGIILINALERAQKLVKKISSSEIRFTFDQIIGTSPNLLNAIEIAKAASSTELNVLLLGESGSGKDVFAQAIHNSSSRKDGPFVPINCGAIPKDLITSELFGYDEGSFTGAKKGGNIGKFEAANNGTIFLDEIGEMPYELQSTLLRVLEQRVVYKVGGREAVPINVRVIAATNKDLLKEVSNNKFRADLYYRLNIISINIPPLRERKDDIKPLCQEFLTILNIKYGKNITTISDETYNLFTNYNWPGNIRELQNIIERSLALSNTEIITPEIIPNIIKSNCTLDNKKVTVTEPSFIQFKDMDLNTVVKFLEKNYWNISKTAKEIGVARSTLYRKMESYSISKGHI